jgi:hypothetical protein
MANELNLEGIDFTEPTEGVKVQSRSARYSAEKCVYVDSTTGDEKFFPVQGIVVGATYQKADSKKPFWDLEIRLTKPSYGVSGKKLTRLEVGDTMLIAATKRLEPWVQVAKRENPDTMPEIWLIPSEKIDIGGDQSLWEYGVRIIAHHDAKDVGAMSALMAEKVMQSLPTSNHASS